MKLPRHILRTATSRPGRIAVFSRVQSCTRGKLVICIAIFPLCGSVLLGSLRAGSAADILDIWVVLGGPPADSKPSGTAVLIRSLGESGKAVRYNSGWTSTFVHSLKALRDTDVF